jgi:ABC-type molybdate transport system permease subunit
MVISTDPAHSLADALDVPLAAAGTPIGDNLWGQQLDAQERMEESWVEIKAYLMAVFDWAGVDSIEAEELAVIAFTLKVAALGTIIILPFGLLAALGLARYQGPGKGVLETLLALPLVLPPTAIGLLLLELLGRRGLAGSWLAAHGIEVVFTWKAVLFATAVMSFPLLVRSARTAFEEVDPRLVGLARTLGCGPLRAFFRVTLPLAWRGVLAGTVLVTRG